MIIDVAPGADWTAMVAIVMALRQVGAARGRSARAPAACPPPRARAAPHARVDARVRPTHARFTHGHLNTHTQVGAHFVKDAFKNYVFQPLTGAAVGGAIEASGLSQAAQAVGSVQDAAMEYVRKAQEVHRVRGRERLRRPDAKRRGACLDTQDV